MIYPTFIEFFSEKPQCSHSIFTANTIHLKPYSDEVYAFALPGDANYSIGTCGFVDSKGIEHQVTAGGSYNNGKSYLNISNILFDKWEMGYFIVRSTLGNVIFYSSLLRVSSIDIEKTTYIKFRDNLWEYFGGVRLNLNFWHKKPMNEITTYYQVTREQTVSVGSKRQHIERYYLENVEINAATALCDILTYPIIYFNGVRTSCYEMPEVEDLKGDENFVSFDLMVTKNYNDIDENNIDLSVYVIGNSSLNQIIGDFYNIVFSVNQNMELNVWQNFEQPINFEIQDGVLMTDYEGNFYIENGYLIAENPISEYMIIQA